MKHYIKDGQQKIEYTSITSLARALVQLHGADRLALAARLIASVVPDGEDREFAYTLHEKARANIDCSDRHHMND